MQELQRTLDSDPTRLKDVFLESIKLQSLHDALIKEITSSRGHGDGSGSGSEGRARSATAYNSSDEGARRMVEAVEQHLSVVPLLARKIRETLWNAINSYDQMLDVAGRSPQTLVATFEIVEMHQEYMDRRLFQVQQSGQLEGVDPDTVAQLVGYEPLSDECQARIKLLLEQHVETNFLLDDGSASAGRGMTRVVSFLSAGTRLMADIAYFKVASFAPLLGVLCSNR